MARLILVILATAITLSHATMSLRDPVLTNESDMKQGRGLMDKLTAGFPGLLTDLGAKLGASFGGKLSGGVGVGINDGQVVGAKGNGEYHIKGTVDGKYQGGLGLLTDGKGTTANTPTSAITGTTGTSGPTNTAGTTGTSGPTNTAGTTGTTGATGNTASAVDPSTVG